MDCKAICQHSLGLETPWTVKEVKLNVQAEEIAVQVNHPQGDKVLLSGMPTWTPLL